MAGGDDELAALEWTSPDARKVDVPSAARPACAGFANARPPRGRSGERVATHAAHRGLPVTRSLLVSRDLRSPPRQESIGSLSDISFALRRPPDILVETNP